MNEEVVENKAEKLTPGMIPNKSQRLTVEKLKKFIPRGCHPTVNEDIVDMLNRMEDDCGLPQEYMEEKVLSSLHMLKGRSGVGIEKLTNALKYCNLKQNMSNEQAWAIVFPEKYERLISEGKQVDNHVSMFNRSDLVLDIDKSMLLAASIQYMPENRMAMERLVGLMNGKGANEGEKAGPMVQYNAAKTIYEMTVMPEDNNINLKIGMDEETKSVQQNLADQLAKMSSVQMKRIEAGEDIGEVQKIGVKVEQVIDVEVE